ncbi:MAG: histone deacetylase [Pseudomonadota bacterium]|nr:histone deacetylase [Pseudomonadota bacterium]
MKAFHSDRLALVLPPGHTFPASKYRKLRELVESWPEIELHEAAAADDATLSLAHEPAYVSAVVGNRLDVAEQRAIGFPWSESMLERSRRSVGATIAAARAALVDGIAANLAGGTHHASASRGSGYCVFNDVAVASRLLQAERAQRPLRIAVIDLDVHQGDGTASIFADDPTVFTLSLHGARNFPFRKARSDLDVGLADGCGDADYLAALSDALDALEQEHRAGPFGLAFYLAGADPHEDDRLGRLKLSSAGLLERDRAVLERLSAWRVPVALAMAGGYGRNLDVTAAIQAATLRAGIDFWRQWNNAGP